MGTPTQSWGVESPSDSPSPWNPHCPRGLCSSENQPSAIQVATRGFLMKPALLGCRIQNPAPTDAWQEPPKELSSLSPAPFPCSDIYSKRDGYSYHQSVTELSQNIIELSRK